MLAKLSQESGIQYTRFVNVNLQRTPQDIARATLMGMIAIDSPFIKYEAMNATYSGSVNNIMIEATKIIQRMAPDAVIMPQIFCEVEGARWFLENTECPILRVQCSGIGSKRGIEDPDEFRKLVQLADQYNVPVWLEGGVGALSHIEEGIELGASGCLLGSWQFHDVSSPPVVLQKCRKEITKLFETAIRKRRGVVA
jgi:thiazole synthase ThiGH ThiG subunit